MDLVGEVVDMVGEMDMVEEVMDIVGIPDSGSDGQLDMVRR